jgi:hypothetical protein
MSPCTATHSGLLCLSKWVSDGSHVQNSLKQEAALLLLLFNSVLKCAIKKVQGNQVELKLNRTHQLHFI